MATTTKPWQEIAAEKQKLLLASIPQEWIIPSELKPSEDILDVMTFPKSSGFFTEDELAITASSASTIVDQISKGVWTAEKVTLAFSKMAAVGHQLVSISYFKHQEGSQNNVV